MNISTIKNTVFVMFSALMILSSCKGQSNSANDEDSTQTADIADDFVSPFTIEHFSYADSSEYAYVTCNFDLPVNKSDEAKSIRKILYKNVIESNNSFLETKISPYKDGNLVDFAQYCGVALFDNLGEMSETTYLTNIAEQRENSEEESNYSVEVMPFSTFDTVVKTYETEQFIVFLYHHEVFLGGAHGSYINIPLTFSSKTGKLIDNILNKDKVKDMQPLLWKGVKDYFIEMDPDMKDTDVREQLFIEGNEIPLPATEPQPMRDGLSITYACYEIAPYAAGEVSFIIPYDKVKPYLTNKAKQLLGL